MATYKTIKMYYLNKSYYLLMTKFTFKLVLKNVSLTHYVTINKIIRKYYLNKLCDSF